MVAHREDRESFIFEARGRTQRDNAGALQVNEQQVALRRWSAGAPHTQAAVELLLRAFHGRFARPGCPWIVSEPDGTCWVDWRELVEANMSVLSGGERRLLLFAASLGAGAPADLREVAGLDITRIRLVLAAIGSPPGSATWFPGPGRLSNEFIGQRPHARRNRRKPLSPILSTGSGRRRPGQQIGDPALQFVRLLIDERQGLRGLGQCHSCPASSLHAGPPLACVVPGREFRYAGLAGDVRVGAWAGGQHAMDGNLAAEHVNLSEALVGVYY